MNDNFDLCKEGHVITPDESRCQFGHPRRTPKPTKDLAAEAAARRWFANCHEPEEEKEDGIRKLTAIIEKAMEELKADYSASQAALRIAAGLESRAAHASDEKWTAMFVARLAGRKNICEGDFKIAETHNQSIEKATKELQAKLDLTDGAYAELERQFIEGQSRAEHASEQSGGGEWTVTPLEHSVVLRTSGATPPIWFTKTGDQILEKLEAIAAAHNATLRPTPATERKEGT